MESKCLEQLSFSGQGQNFQERFLHRPTIFPENLVLPKQNFCDQNFSEVLLCNPQIDLILDFSYSRCHQIFSVQEAVTMTWFLQTCGNYAPKFFQYSIPNFSQNLFENSLYSILYFHAASSITIFPIYNLNYLSKYVHMCF